MKKLLALLLAMIMVFSLCACGDKESKEKDDDTDASGSVETTAPADEGGDDVEEPGNTDDDKTGDDEIVIPGTDIGNTDDVVEIPFKNVSANINVTAEGETVPGTFKFDFENQEFVLNMTNNDETISIAVDSEGMYMVGEENGEVTYSQVQKFADIYGQAFAQAGLPEFSEEQIKKITESLESMAGMFTGEKDFDMNAIADLLKELGADGALSELYAELGITEDQAEKMIQAVIDLLNDEQWVKDSFNINNTVVDGTGSFSMSVDLGKVVYDIAAAVYAEMDAGEVPSYEESGINSIPLAISAELESGIPTKLDASVEVEGQKFELNITNKISDNGIDFDAKVNAMGVIVELAIDCTVTDNSFDFDATLSMMGQSYGIAVDGKADDNSFELTADISAMGETMRVLEIKGTATDNSVSIELIAGPEGDKLVLNLDGEIDGDKLSKVTVECEAAGEKFSISADLFDYDSTTVDLDDIKAKAEAGMAA